MNLRLLFFAISLSFVACNNNSKNNIEDNTTSDSVITEVQSPDSLANAALLDSIKQASEKQPEQLVPKHILTTEDLYRDYDNGNDLSIFFKIETISKDSFLTHLSTAVDYMFYDSASIIKSKGLLTLPLEHGKLRLEDKIADNDSHHEYRYIGQLKALDMYLVLGTFWEDWEYILYDKKHGNKVQTFINQPYLSADKQHIICLDIDSFEGITNISMYGVTTNDVTLKKYIDPIVEMFIKSWVPYTQKYSMFWGNDGYFYVPVIYSDNYLNAQNNFNGLDQYIRILPLAS